MAAQEPVYKRWPMVEPGSLQTAVAGVVLEHPLINAAGTCKTLDDVKRLARSAVSAVTVGSITAQEREGNSGEVFAQRVGYCVNALGMPNRGADFYREQLPFMAQECHDLSKPLILSVAGFNPDEYFQLAELGSTGGADLIELNLGCPNVWADGQQKRIFSFDPQLVSDVVVGSVAAADGKPVGVKLSPFSDPVLLAEVAAALNQSGADFVVSCNTFPNGVALDAHYRTGISVGYGGVSGEALKSISLGQISQLRSVLRPEVSIIGCGGLAEGSEINEFLAVGANAVGSASAFWRANEDPAAYSALLHGYVG